MTKQKWFCCFYCGGAVEGRVAATWSQKHFCVSTVEPTWGLISTFQTDRVKRCSCQEAIFSNDRTWKKTAKLHLQGDASMSFRCKIWMFSMNRDVLYKSKSTFCCKINFEKWKHFAWVWQILFEYPKQSTSIWKGYSYQTALFLLLGNKWCTSTVKSHCAARVANQCSRLKTAPGWEQSFQRTAAHLIVPLLSVKQWTS